MGLTLYIAKEWHDHLRQVFDSFPACVPVIKGNGYGFGNTLLAHTARQLGKTQIAVGTIAEARQILQEQRFDDVLVLVPTMASLIASDLAGDMTFTVGHPSHLEHLVQWARHWKAQKQPVSLNIVVKCQTSMHRFGFPPTEVRQVKRLLDKLGNALDEPIGIKGFSLHLPSSGMTDQEKAEAVSRWAVELAATDWAGKVLYVSHLSPQIYQSIASQHPAISLVMRMGANLWQSDPHLYPRSMVLAVQEVAKGQRFGYWQQQARRSMRLMHVAGGTANGIGFEPPARISSLGAGVRQIVTELLSLWHLRLSPFYYNGQRLWYAEPPHMQVSILRLPDGVATPEIGAEIPVAVRMSLTRFDRCQLLERS